MTDTPTINDPDIFRAVKLLIDRHSGAAPIRALERAEEFADKGDLEGVAVWRRILSAGAILTQPPIERTKLGPCGCGRPEDVGPDVGPDAA